MAARSFPAPSKLPSSRTWVEPCALLGEQSVSKALIKQLSIVFFFGYVGNGPEPDQDKMADNASMERFVKALSQAV